jgi:dihydroorotate dehydrogenase
VLAAQARLPGGPRLFAALAQGRPPEAARTEFLGIEFASAVGIGAGIDVCGRALALLRELGVGFVEIGPLGRDAVARSPATDPRRLRAVHGLALSGARGGPAAEDVLARLPALRIPLGVSLRAEHLLDGVAAARERAAFLTLPPAAGDRASLLRDVRAAAGDRPVLVRVLAGWEPRRIDAILRRAEAAGIDGVLVVAGTSYAAMPDGELVCNGALPRALAVVERVAERLPTALSGGVLTPEDAAGARAAGAGLVALTDGLVYAGPGLPRRANRRLAAKAAPAIVADPPLPAPTPPDRRTLLGRFLLALVTAGLVFGGLVLLVLAATVQLMPNDTDHLGMSVAELCRKDDCRIVDFIAHDRASFGGTVTAIGLIYAWLVGGPLRRGEPWAWWALLLSGAAGYLGFLSFVGYGYLDTWHGVTTLVLVALWIPGLVLTRRAVVAGGRGGFRAALDLPGAAAWRWSPAGRGRLGMLLLAGGMLSAGLTILVVAMTTVFVPQDTAFMQLDRSQLDAINPRLVSVIAHDRAEFGAGLVALGILFGLSAWKAIRPGAHGVWPALASAGAVLFGAAWLAHPVIGYTSFTHLMPVYGGAALLVAALVPLRAALRQPQGDPAAFPDV